MQLTHDDVTNDEREESDVGEQEAENLPEDLAARAASWRRRRLGLDVVGDGRRHFPDYGKEDEQLNTAYRWIKS